MSITLGAVYNLTGGQAGLDIPSARGAQLAVAEANARGGVLERPVELILIDGETDPAVLARKTAALLREHPAITALLGLSDTDMVLAAAGAAAEAERLFVTSGATSPRLPDQIPTYLFLAAFGDNVQAAAGAEYAVAQMGAGTAVVVYRDEDTFTELLQGYFTTRFTELGGRVVEHVSYTTEAELDEALVDLPAADLVYFSAAPDDVIDGIIRMRALGIATPVMGGDSFDLGEAWAAHPALSDIIFTTHAFVDPTCPDPAMAPFITAFEASNEGDDPGAFGALGYDTVRLILHSIEEAGTAEPAAVLEAMAGLQSFTGLTGTISYDDGRRVPTKSVSLLAVAGGRVTLAGQVTPGGVPAP